MSFGRHVSSARDHFVTSGASGANERRLQGPLGKSPSLIEKRRKGCVQGQKQDIVAEKKKTPFKHGKKQNKNKTVVILKL